MSAVYVPMGISLPELPRTKRTREANITPKVLEYFRENYPYPCAIEIKVSPRKYISENALLPHQKLALLAASSPQGLVHKLSDEAMRRQPFDAFLLKNTHAYVVAVFLHKDVRLALAIKVEDWQGATPDSPCDFNFMI